MTLGQRIQELRKQQGLSQESLGEKLGVSRQAVSKWEGDNGIPELDTLIAMSRLFDVTVGQLLGVEEPPAQQGDTMNEDLVEEVLRRYAEQIRQNPGENPITVPWKWLSVAALAVAAVVIVLFSMIGSLRNTVKYLRSDLSSLQVQMSNQQNALSGQIRNTLYDILAEEEELLSTFQWTIADLDLEGQTATLLLEATMKEYRVGSQLQFCAKWLKADGSTETTVGEWSEGPEFQSEITLPMNHGTDVSIRVRDQEGNIQEQLLHEPIYGLNPDYFHLQAYDLLQPFAITVSGRGHVGMTSKGEHAYVQVFSGWPEYIRPEKAVLIACLNQTEIFRETLTIEPSEKEHQLFSCSIRDLYYDLTMKDGDVLTVQLVVTDNLGRTEEFAAAIAAENGTIRRTESAVAAVPVG